MKFQPFGFGLLKSVYVLKAGLAYLTSELLNSLQFYCKIGQFLSEQSLIHDCYRIHVCHRGKCCFLKEIEN